MSPGADDRADESGEGQPGYWDPDEVFVWDDVPSAPVTLYDKLNIDDESGAGPVNKRFTTLSEVDRGHASVLEEFRRRPGRWLLWMQVDDTWCKTCGVNSGRYLQFAFLEDAAGVIGECGSSEMLDDCCKYTPEQERALRSLGWRDPIEGTTPNLFFQAMTGDELAALAVLSLNTLHEVMELGPDHRLLVMFQERFLIEEAA